jgi:hypothetical protein
MRDHRLIPAKSNIIDKYASPKFIFAKSTFQITMLRNH